MHNREITHIVKTESLSKNQLVVRTKSSFCCHLRETYVKTAKMHPYNNTFPQNALTVATLLHLLFTHIALNHGLLGIVSIRLPTQWTT